MRASSSGMIIAGVALLVSFLGGAAADCPNSCSHRGTCNVFSQCECFAGRIGADCSERVCPSAQAWVGTPEGTDNAHQQAECANAGVCDRSSGQCECFKAFSGHACQRLVCPASAGGECSGHGKCLTMEHYATQLPTHDPYHYGLDGLHSLSHESFQVDDTKQVRFGCGLVLLHECFLLSDDNLMSSIIMRVVVLVSYNTTQIEFIDLHQAQLGSTESALRSWYAYNEVWDAAMVQGCMCDYPWVGFDCSERECPRGDDPLTVGQSDEVQLVECNTTYRRQYVRLLGDRPILEGTFALRYGAEVTRPMPHNATPATMASRLRALDGIRGDFSADDDGEVLVSLTETPSFSSSVSPSSQEENVQRVWNLTINAKSDQSPLVPLFKQPEVQRIECAADRGFLTLHFPAPHDTGSAFSGICLGGPKAGRDCAVSSECSGGVRTGDGAKCGLKLTEDVQLKHDATAAEVRAALEGFSLVDRVHVNFSDTTADSLCTAGGNGATVAFLRTRLDFATGGDLPMLSASAGASLRRKSVPVADGHGAMFLSPVREVVKGADSCAIEEVQSVSCRARGGDIVVSLLASSAKVPFNATAAQTKGALQTLAAVENVTVEFLAEGQADSFCGQGDDTGLARITFHAMASSFHGDGHEDGHDDGDVPELSLDGSSLTPLYKVIVPSAATEVVKGLACAPLGEPFQPTRDDDRVRGQHFDQRAAQMEAGEVYPHRDGGKFALSFRGETTAPIAARASASDVASALNGLSTLHGAVAVTFGRSQHACESPANVMAVTFLGDFGPNLAPLQVDDHQMPPTSHLKVRRGGATDSSGLFASVGGTKENDVCSNHGRCDASLGVCDCFTAQDFGYDHAFTSSDGRGGPGTRGDCGYAISPRGDPRSKWHMRQHDRSGGAAILGTYTEATKLVQERSWGKDFPVTDCPGLLGCSGHG